MGIANVIYGRFGQRVRKGTEAKALSRSFQASKGGRCEENRRRLLAREVFRQACEMDEQEGASPEVECLYKRAIELDPSYADAWMNLGTVRFARGSEYEARSLYEKAIEVDPKNARAIYNLGCLDLCKGELESAMGRFQRATQLDPRWGDAHYNLAEVYRLRGNREAQARHLLHFLAYVPKNDPFWSTARDSLREMNVYYEDEAPLTDDEGRGEP